MLRRPIFKIRRLCLTASSRPCRSISTLPANSELPIPRLNYEHISENVTSKCLNALSRKAPISSVDISAVARHYVEWKRIRTELNAKYNTRSITGEQIRKCVENNDEAGRATTLAEAVKLKEDIRRMESELEAAEQQCLELALAIPNDTHPDVPLGPESSAVILSTHGPDPIPTDPTRDHVAICNKFDLLDLEAGSTVTGNSWYFSTNEAALLELALTNYAMSIAIQHGFSPVMTPDVVRSDIATRCGFQPRDDSDPPVSHMYHLSSTNPSSPELVLSGTSEIPLAGMFANKISPITKLPLKVVGLGHAFRSEAGARSMDTRGLYRVHQFTKLELFAVTAGDGSESMMEDMLAVQKAILNGLKIPYRVLDMPSEELGASAYRKYDIEAWMPGRGSWGEVASLSNCTDYQARRLHIRYRPLASEGSLPFAHTLNGTAAAIPRIIITLLENGIIFNEHGKIKGLRLPRALKPFWIEASHGKLAIEWES